ncbi:unnamed protein product [Amaranthus hypochondriacus]
MDLNSDYSDTTSSTASPSSTSGTSDSSGTAPSTASPSSTSGTSNSSGTPPSTATPVANTPPTKGTADSSGTAPSTATPVANTPPTKGTADSSGTVPSTATPVANTPPTRGTAGSSGTAPSTATPVSNPSPTTGTSVCSYDGSYFKPRVINVASGEDVCQKILSLIQQTKRGLCILSAKGFTSSASLHPPTTFGKNGYRQILSLTGSVVYPHSGELTGGLSATLLDTDGQIVGGCLVGPLIAAGPVEVCVGTFLVKPAVAGPAGVQKHASSSSIPKN